MIPYTAPPPSAETLAYPTRGEYQKVSVPFEVEIDISPSSPYYAFSTINASIRTLNLHYERDQVEFDVITKSPRVNIEGRTVKISMLLNATRITPRFCFEPNLVLELLIRITYVKTLSLLTEKLVADYSLNVHVSPGPDICR